MTHFLIIPVVVKRLRNNNLKKKLAKWEWPLKIIKIMKKTDLFISKASNI